MAGSSRTLNTKLLVLLLGAAATVLITVLVVHRIQVRRNASGLANLARMKRDEGQTSESIGLFARYLQFRPNDAAASAEFARLCLEQAERAGASPAQRQLAYDALDAAVRRNPDDLELRSRLAQIMLRFARFADAVREVDVINERLAEAGGEAAADTLDRDELGLMRAQGLAGSGRYPEAAAAAAEVVGFDLASRTFTGGKEPGAATLAAAIVLADVLNRRLKDPETAYRVIQQVATLCEDDYRAWVTLAGWQRDAGKKAESAESVKRAARLAPDERDVLFAAIDLAIADERFAEAQSLAERVRETYPEDERAYRGMALALARQGNVDQALRVLRGALKDRADIKIDPSFILLMVGDLELQKQNYNGVEGVLSEYTSLFGPGNPSAVMLEARLLIAQQKWLPATQKLEQARPLVSSSEQLTRQVDLLLGQCHERLGQYDEQLAANRRVLSEEYDSLIARVGTAEALIGNGKPDEALAELETIAAGMTEEQLTGFPQVWRPLLRLRAEAQARRPPAERDWSLVDRLIDRLEQSPLVSTSELNMLKADAQTRRGDPAGAAEFLRREIDVNPAHNEAWAALIMLALRHEGADAARDVLARLPATAADEPLLLLVGAQLAANSPGDERDTAFSRVEARATSAPDHEAGRLLASLAMIQRSIGRTEDAERLLAAARKRTPDDLNLVMMLFEMACERGDVAAATTLAGDISRLAGETSATGRVAAAARRILAVRVRRSERVNRLQATDGAIDLDDEERQLLADANVQLILAENERPGWGQIQQLFAEIAAMRGDTVEAIDHLQRAVTLNAGSPAVIRQLVSLLYSANRMAEAQQMLATLGSRGGAGGLERLSAELEIGSGQLEGAVAIAERALEENDNLSVGDLLWFGQVLSRAKKMEQAAAVFERALERDPARAEPWLALFAAQLAGGWQQRAEKTLRDATAALEPPTRQLVTAQCQEMLGNNDDAERGFREAVAASPGNALVARGLASFLIRRGRLDAARLELDKLASAAGEASGTKSARIWARRALAGIIAAPGGYQDAARATALLERNISDEGRRAPEDLTLLASLLAPRPETDNWRRALDALQQLAAIQPLSTAQQLDRIRLLESIGDWEDCRREFLTLVSPANAPVEHLGLFVEALIRHGELDAAETWLRNLRQREPNAAGPLTLEARLALARNDRGAAISVARRLLPGALPAGELNQQLGAIVPLMEELGFKKAADSLLERWGGLSPVGLISRVEFLGREHRAEEALDLLEQYFERISPERIMRTAVNVLDAQGGSVAPALLERVDRWFDRFMRADPDAVGLALLRAELRGLEGRDEDVRKIYAGLLARPDLAPMQRGVVANNMAFQLARPETAAEARKFVEIAVETLGPHPDVLDTRGLVLLAQGDAPSAVEALQEAVLDRSATKYLHLACALAADQRLETARKMLAEARRRGLDSVRLAEQDVALLRSLEKATGG